MNKYLYIASFLVLLIAPTLLDLVGYESKEAKRNASKVEIHTDEKNEYSTVFSRFSDQHKKNNSLRFPLLRLNDRLKQFFFDAPARDRSFVIKGSENWLFSNSRNLFLPDIKRENYLSSSQMDSFYQSMVLKDSIAEALDARFVKYILPDAHNIYCNQLPNAHARNACGKQSRTDLLAKHLDSMNVNNFFYPIEILTTQKDKHLLYFKNDTHWNEYGASIVASDIIERFFSLERDDNLLSNYKVKWFHHLDSINQFVKKKKRLNKNVLTNKKYYALFGTDQFLGREKKIIDSIPLFLPEKKLHYKIENMERQFNFLFRYDIKNDKALSDISLVIFGDSFVDGMVNFLIPYFKEIHFRRGGLTDSAMKELNSINADIIMEFHVERHLTHIQ